MSFETMQAKLERLKEVGKQEVGEELPRPDATPKPEKTARYARR